MFDRVVNTPVVQPTASIVSLVIQRLMLDIKGFGIPLKIIQVVQRQCPPSRRSKRSLRYQVLFMDEVVEMPVVMKSKDV